MTVRLMRIEDFQNHGPALILEEYFSGITRAWGMFLDRFGRVRRQFMVDIHGTWTPADRRLDLTEHFQYEDGATETRRWTLHRTGPGEYEGAADDVIGIARGRALGNAFHWRYTLALPMGGRTVKLAFDDWMFLQPQGVLLNRATVTKWGLEVGTVSIAYSKSAEGDATVAAGLGAAAGPAMPDVRTRKSAAE